LRECWVGKIHGVPFIGLAFSRRGARLKPEVSAIVITYNEESNIDRCLRSLSWCEDVIVVDSFSTDRTVDIARAMHCTVLQHAYDGDIRQRERGFAVAKHPWLLYVDADEECSPELIDEIRTVTASPRALDGYEVPRKVSVLGRWIVHGGWSPDYSFRLFRKDQVVSEHAEVHGGFTVKGKKGTLTSFLNHYTYPTFETYLAKMNDYTSLQVDAKMKNEYSMTTLAFKALFSPVSHFLRKYFVQQGYRDGLLGFFLAALGSIYTLALYGKVWEYTFRQSSGGPLPPVTNLELGRSKRRYHQGKRT
jgi:glycosyltransferase involved in cell wall biosynthesis